MTSAAGFNPLVERALQFTLEAHAGQERKGQPGVPYVVHPLHVALILAAHGLPAEVCCAGLLHDVVEDCNVAAAQIEEVFGPVVAGYVAEVSEDRSRSWQQRKQHTIGAIATMSDAARAVLAADKLHNLADIARQEDRQGERIWSAFPRGKAAFLEYYTGVARELRRHFPHPLTDALVALLPRWGVVVD